jgi:uncharacterized protein with LGFP repeats
MGAGAVSQTLAETAPASARSTRRSAGTAAAAASQTFPAPASEGDVVGQPLAPQAPLPLARRPWTTQE